jgi:hypothetical protein
LGADNFALLVAQRYHQGSEPSVREIDHLMAVRDPVGDGLAVSTLYVHVHDEPFLVTSARRHACTLVNLRQTSPMLWHL